MPASDVPGWAGGWRFNAANFTSPNFTDQSGFGNPLEVLNGTPAFATVDGHEGVVLDNTWNGRFWHCNAWEGTILLVARLDRTLGGTYSKFLINFTGATGGSTSNRAYATFVGTSRQLFMRSGSVTTPAQNIGDSSIGVVAMCHDQQRKNVYSTQDGVSVSSGTAGTGTTNGVAYSVGSSREGAYFGMFTGDITDTTLDTDANIHAFEMHQFIGNPQVDHATELAGFISELNTAYA